MVDMKASWWVDMMVCNLVDKMVEWKVEKLVVWRVGEMVEKLESHLAGSKAVLMVAAMAA